MDPITRAVVNAATKETTAALMKESEGFLQAVLGEPAKALGGLLTDKVNRRRHANLIKITVEAKRKLDEAGVSPKEVPLKIIHPMLEAASLEDDVDLQTRWANLIANSADPREKDEVLPIFTAILKELTPGHAVLLGSLYDDAFRKAEGKSLPTQVLYDMFELKLLFEPPKVTKYAFIGYTNQFVVVIEILKRNGLLIERTAATNILNAAYADAKFSLSDLGIAFVRACRAPLATSKPVTPPARMAV